MKTFNLDLQSLIDNFIKNRSTQLKTFIILFVITLIAYGQKLFFYSLPADDYMRFGGDRNVNMLITHSARWGQALLNKYVFVGQLQILPYLHGFLGILSFALMGYLSALYFEKERRFEIVTIAMLIAITPPIAHNLYFSTNITTWLTLLLGLIGFFLLDKPNWASKFFGFLFIVFSIANYQTIIQILLILLLFKSLHLLIKDPYHSIFRIILQGLAKSFFILFAYIVSMKINTLFLKYYHLHQKHRLAEAQNALSFDMIMHHIKRLFLTPIELHYLNVPLHTQYLLLFLLLILAFCFWLYKEPIIKKRKIHLFIFFAISFTLLIPLLNLPILLVNWIPTRAHLPIGWLLGGALALLYAFRLRFFKNLAIVFTFTIVTCSLYYASIFFDSCYRQTNADIRRANMIVERIRTHPNYTKEPMGFYIVGQKKFNVEGWDLKWQQPFDSFWAKYEIFKHFTDFHFHYMSKKGRNEIIDYIIKTKKRVYDYPGKDSVIVYKNNAILLLNASKINIFIKKERLIKQIPLDQNPVYQGKFKLYIHNNTLFYYKENCTEQDIRNKFFLRLYPLNPLTKVNGKIIYPFQTWDFKFWLYGKKIDHTCIAAVELPNYALKKIRTGQFAGKGLEWDIFIPIKNNQ